MNYTSKKTVKDLLKLKNHVNVNLGAGESLISGFINVDIVPKPGIDIVCDLEKYPWPFPSGSVNLLVASQLVEHIDPHGGNFIRFMDEAWRVLKTDGQFMIATPYGQSAAYIQDPTHCNPCNELTWSYFDPHDDMSGGMLYMNYRPKPWRILENSWYSQGNMEVLLQKRLDDPSYHTVEITKNRTLTIYKPEPPEKEKK